VSQSFAHSTKVSRCIPSPITTKSSSEPEGEWQTGWKEVERETEECSLFTVVSMPLNNSCSLKLPLTFHLNLRKNYLNNWNAILLPKGTWWRKKKERWEEKLYVNTFEFSGNWIVLHQETLGSITKNQKVSREIQNFCERTQKHWIQYNFSFHLIFFRSPCPFRGSVVTKCWNYFNTKWNKVVTYITFI